MKAVVNEINSYTRELDIHVDWEEMKENYSLMVKKYHSDYQRKGFRKGKVPMPYFKKEMGPAVEMEFSDKALNDYYYQALQDNGLTPINKAKIDHFHFHENSDLHFKAEFEIIPSFQLPDYGAKLKFKLTVIEKTENDLVTSMERLQQNFVKYEAIPGPSKENDFLFGDLIELDESGNPNPQKKHADQTIKIDPAIFKDHDINEMLGKKAGDTCKIHPEVNENKISYKIVIKEIRESILPELNDEFAKSVRPDVENLDQLKSKVNEEIQHELDKTNQKSRDNHIIEYFIKNTPFDIPTSMIDRYLDGAVEEFKAKAEQGMPVNEQQIREDYKPHADNSLRWIMVKTELIKVEDLKIEKSHMDAKFESLAANFNMAADKVEAIYKKSDKFDEFKEDLLEELLFNTLASKAKIKEVIKTTDQMKEDN